MGNRMFRLGFDATAVVTDDGRKVGYAQLGQMADAWAEGVEARALGFLLVGNNLESLVAYVACLNHGIVPVMLDARIDGDALGRLVAAYEPDFVWRAGNGAPGKVRARGGLHPDLALLLTTSGSTGSPKLVRQSYGNIRANTASIVEYLGLGPGERAITTLPMNYTYGLSIINTHLAVGATLLLTEKSLMQREFWNFFADGGATSFGGVPYTYEMLDKLMFFRRKLPSLRTMTQAGGKLLPALHRKFAEYAAREGKNFVVMYGQCEATARMAYLPPERALDKVGSMGIAIPGGKFTLVDADGREIADAGVTGELVYEGANVTLGYAECRADLAKGDERHGRLETGDMAQRDEEGFYTIVGRKKRFLKIFGNRVNLDETERLVKERFPGLDCACGGVDDKMKVFVAGFGLRVSGSSEGKDGGELDEIRAFLAEKTHLNFSSFEMRVVDTIPKNASGKTLYSELPP